jgi:hypothetical protein
MHFNFVLEYTNRDTSFPVYAEDVHGLQENINTINKNKMIYYTPVRRLF